MSFVAVILLMGVCLTRQLATAASEPAPAESPAKPFQVRGFHVPFRPTAAPLSRYLELFDELAGRGYNTVFLSLGSTSFSVFTIPEPGVIIPDGVTPADIQALIRHARSRGLEPVLEIKLIGKQRAVLGKLDKKLPGLLCQHEGKSRVHQQQVINPNYVLPDGRDVFEAILFPEVDYFLKLYGGEKPKYFLLGIDEFSVEELDVCAKQKNTTAAALFADTLNRITSHVLAQGVTPIIWGDMFLSHQLAQPGHGVEGFAPDPRMSHPQFAYHAEFQSTNGVSVLTAMNALQHRDQIIMADWQYGTGDPHGEFPSVDYFKKMGFKDVWGTTWYNQDGMRNFSRYAARRGCEGMIASTWHTFLSKDVKYLLPVIIQNSIVYFKNPDFTPPIENLPLTITSAGMPSLNADSQPPLFRRPLQTLTFSAQVPSGIVPVEPVLRIQGALGRLTFLTGQTQVRMNYRAQEHRLEARVELSVTNSLPLMFDAFVEFTCADSGYFVQSFQRNCMGVVEQSPPSTGTAAPDTLFHADFSGLSAQAFQGQLLRAGGKFGGLVFVEPPEPSKPPQQDGALDCRWMTAAYAYPPTALWDVIYTDGLCLRAEFRLGGGAQGGQYPTLLGYGTFQAGFRIFLGPNNQIVLNIARGKNGFSPLQITCPNKVPANRWTTLELLLSPPNASRQRTVSLRVGDAEALVTTLPIDIVKAHAPLALGVAFDPSNELVGAKGSKFPGLIRKVELAPYASVPPTAPSRIRQAGPSGVSGRE